VIRVLVIDDHPVVRCGLGLAIAREPGMALAGAGSTAREGAALARTEPVDVVVLDLRLPDAGAGETVRQIRSASPSARILVLDIDEPDEELYRALEAGAAGCVGRDEEVPRILEAIRRVHQGLTCLPPEIAAAWTAYRARRLTPTSVLPRGTGDYD
jgi:DNA-binding NarL/FixJ family response regulator